MKRGVPKKPTKKVIHQFGLTLLVGFGLIGTLLFFKGRQTVAIGMWGGAASICALSFISPPLAAPLNFLWMKLGALLGAISSRVVTFLIYFLIFTPLAIFFRLRGRDILVRKKPSIDSYWNIHPEINDKDNYTHLS